MSDKPYLKNAFKSACRTDLFRLLAENGVPSELLDEIDSFRWDRSIILNTNEHYFNIGLP